MFKASRLFTLVFWSFMLQIITRQLVTAQGLCDKTNRPADAVEGAFKIEGDISIGCSPLTVKLKDLSGGTDLRYDFYYSGQDANALDKVGNKDSVNALFANNNVEVYRILQYGKKNGKDMYSCKTISVRPKNKPDISYEACNNSVIVLTIRKSQFNDFDTYNINWSDGSVDKIPNGTILPYSVKKTFPNSATQSLSIDAHYNAVPSCSSSQMFNINMNRGDQFPRISKITLNEKGDEAVLTLSGNPDAIYNISSRQINQSGNPISFLSQKVQIGEIRMPITDVNISQCFFVGRSGAACQEYSNEVCTIPFQVKENNEENHVTLTSPSSGKIVNTGIFTYINNVSSFLERSDAQNNKKIIQINGNHYVDSDIDCSKKYCYTQETQITNSYANYTDLSYRDTLLITQKKCIDRKENHPPSVFEGNAAVNADNSISIQFNDYSLGNIPKLKYYLYSLQNGLATKIDSVTNLTDFIDSNIDASKAQNCYQISFLDKCGSESMKSDSLCSVLLETDNKNIHWTNNSPFGKIEVDKYEIEALDENTQEYKLHSLHIPNSSAYSPNLDPFENVAQFRIKILAKNGEISYSNIVEIPIQPFFSIPDAFSPNGDGINDSLEIKGKFNSVNNISLKVFNRWGIKILEMNEKKPKWDGLLNDELLNNGLYTYQLRILLNNGQNIVKIGKFELLK
jgi:gliding motility-associated-like protein